METISIKIEPNFKKKIAQAMKEFNYMTTTEFWREAARDKISALEKKKMLAHLNKIAGSSKRKTTDEDLHRAREKAVDELERKFGFK